MRRPLAALLVAALLVGSCGGDDDDDEEGLEGLDTPTFETADPNGETSPDEPGSTEGTGATTSAPENSDDGSGQSGPAEPGATTSTAGPPLERVTFDDPVGDATPGVGTSAPPPWTDLAGGSLERQGNAYRMTIRLGGEAPTRATGEETMNIATFYDVDGDGAVEFEIWVNLGSEGWGPVWYDDQGNAAPGEDSNVTVVVEDDEVRLLFPDVMLDQADRLRFSTASEYGELSTIGSSFARRDDAPDNDRAVSFPS